MLSDMEKCYFFLKDEDKISKNLKDKFGLLIADGSNINFWSQEWIEGTVLKLRFPRIYSLAVNKDGMVHSFGSWEDDGWRWNIILRRQCFGWEISQWDEFILVINGNRPLRGGVDRIIWKPSTNGIFTVHSATLELQAINNDMDPFWRKVWTGNVPPKVEFFLWQLVRERVKVRKLLLDRGIIEFEDAKCAFCKTEIESCHHLFFDCRFSWMIWMKLCNVWGIEWVFPGNVKAAFISWFDTDVGQSYLLAWRMLFLASVWSIWLCRNLVIFEDKKPEDIMVYDLILIRLFHWFKAKLPESPIKLWEVVQNPKSLISVGKTKKRGCSRWAKPRQGWVKFTVDAAMVDASYAGIGGILRDDEGKTRGVFSKAINACNIEAAEFLAILEALRIFHQSHFKGSFADIIVESDSLIACNWFNDPDRIHWRLQAQRIELEFLKHILTAVEVSKIPRENNVIADNLAKAGITRISPLVVFL